MRRKDALLARACSTCRSSTRIRTVREFDEAYTAPYFGFADAEDYYHRASAMRVVDRIRVPALIITAEDDPFVPPQPFRDPKVAGNPHITLLACEHGGHCGFVGPSRRRGRRLLGGGSDRRRSSRAPTAERQKSEV